MIEAPPATTHEQPWWPSPSELSDLSPEAQAGLDRVFENDDYVDMCAALTRGSRYGLGGRKIYSEWKDRYTPVPSDASCHLGYWISSGGLAKPGSEAITAAVASADTPTDDLEAACVLATDMITQEALNGIKSDGSDVGSPSRDALQHGHTLTCIAAHPNASARAARQAIRAEGKYSAKEVLRRSRDPELLGFALDETDVGIWHAVDSDGAFNPALPADRLDGAVEHVIEVWRRAEMSDEPAPDGLDHDYEMARSLATHPNLAAGQRQRLTAVIGDRQIKRMTGADAGG